MWTLLKRITFTQWILIGMVIGAAIGHFWPDVAANLKILSTIFLRLIKSIVVPIIFGSLVIGIAGHGEIGRAHV